MLTDGLVWADYTDVSTPQSVSLRLAAAASAITGYCGWDIARTTVIDQVLDGPGGYLLALPTLHLVSLTSISVDDVVRDPGSYRVSQTGMVESTDVAWPAGFGRIKASFIHGYDPVPAAILMVAVAMVLRGPALGDIKSHTETVGQMSFGTAYYPAGARLGLSSLDRVVLDAYRLETSN